MRLVPREYPCVSVCEAEAIYVHSDGHLRIDMDWCICCEHCLAVCPIEAIYINHYMMVVIDIILCQARENNGYGGCRFWAY
jgi:Fe-S-cluster-containing hydrogenase component 2